MDKNITFLEYRKMYSLHDFDDRENVSLKFFSVAENLMHSILKEDYQKSGTKYYLYEKKYLDLDTYQICFKNDQWVRNGGYPCVEMEKKTGRILRITVMSKSQEDKTLSVVPVFNLSFWDHPSLSSGTDQTVRYLGIFQCNQPYYFLNQKLWIDQIPITNEFLAMTAYDYLKNEENDIRDYDCEIVFKKLRDRNICIVWFWISSSSFFKLYNPNAIVFDSDTGQILGYYLQE